MESLLTPEVLDFLTRALSAVPVVAVASPAIAMIADAAKKIGLPDGKAPLLQSVLNSLVYVAYFALNDAGDANLTNALGIFVAIAPSLLALFVALVYTGVIHKVFVKLGLGYSHPKYSPNANKRDEKYL